MSTNNKIQFLQQLHDPNFTGVAYKNLILKKSILAFFANEGNATLNELSKELNISTPKVNDLVTDLMAEGLVNDYGKINAGVGRKPNVYGLEPQSAFFIGVEVSHSYINIGLMDFRRTFVEIKERIPYQLNNDPQSLQSLCTLIGNFVKSLHIQKEKIVGVGINLSGRVNNQTGYSYSYFHFYEDPLSTIIEKEIGIRTYIENDSRAMAFGEFCSGVVNDEKDVLFINIDEGIGMGIMIDSKLYYGKSGFAGEFGHIPTLDNEIICHCGKKGCLETEASGQAITRMLIQKLEEGETSIITRSQPDYTKIKLGDIIDAALHDDMLAIELIAEAGEKLGKGIASLINLFNPELVILGGSLSKSGDYIRLPIRNAINKYSLHLVNSDTQLKMSKLGDKAGITGACLLLRNKILSQ